MNTCDPRAVNLYVRIRRPHNRQRIRGATGDSHGTGLFVLTLTGDRICALTRFDNSVLPWFGLPRSLPRLRKLG